MLTLALDLATVTGFALGDHAGIKVSGSRKLPSKGADLGYFASAYREWLTKGLTRHKPLAIVYEQPIIHGDKANLATLRKLYGLSWQTELTVRDLMRTGVLSRTCTLHEVNMGDWRKHFLGAGNVPRKREQVKQAVMAMCRVRGFAFEDDNEAEAIAILDYALAIQKPATAINATPLFAQVAPPRVMKTAKELKADALRKAAGLKAVG